MIKAGIIGYGYWGPNLLRNFSSAENCTVTHLADLRPERLQVAKRSYPNLQTTENISKLIRNPDVDAIIIATPVFTHFPLAKQALEAGKHVMLEKPMASSLAECEELINLAEGKGKLLMVDHTFLYTGAVRKMRDMIDAGEIGNIEYFDSTRINLGLFQPDVNVLWDLAPHDISILNFLVKDKPYSVQATGKSHTANGLENIAYMTVNYQSKLIAHFNCSWTSPVKLRNILIGGDKKMLLFNDMEPTEKIKVYETGYTVKTDEEKQRIAVDYRAGDIYVPKIATKEALAELAADFVQGILKKRAPVSSAKLGMDVVRILEAAQKSIKQQGKEILL